MYSDFDNVTFCIHALNVGFYTIFIIFVDQMLWQGNRHDRGNETAADPMLIQLLFLIARVLFFLLVFADENGAKRIGIARYRT